MNLSEHTINTSISRSFLSFLPVIRDESHHNSVSLENLLFKLTEVRLRVYLCLADLDESTLVLMNSASM